MADWLSLFSQRTQPELTQCCKQAYSSLDMQQPSSGERRPPCRESEAGVDVLLDSETHPVAAARSGLLSVQVLQCLPWLGAPTLLYLPEMIKQYPACKF